MVVFTFFGIAFLWYWNASWLFLPCGHCWNFQMCCHIECSILTASAFRILNSWAGIPSPPLALFIVMLPKTHLTSHSKACVWSLGVSCSRWVTTLLWLSRPLWFFFVFFWYSSSVYSWHLFLISSVSVRSIPFLSGYLRWQQFMNHIYHQPSCHGRQYRDTFRKRVKKQTLKYLKGEATSGSYRKVWLASLNNLGMRRTWTRWP